MQLGIGVFVEHIPVDGSIRIVRSKMHPCNMFGRLPLLVQASDHKRDIGHGQFEEQLVVEGHLSGHTSFALISLLHRSLQTRSL